MSIETYNNVLTSNDEFMAEIEIETAAEITSMESYAHSTLRELDYEHSGHTGFAGIKYGTTAEWETQGSYVPAKNVLIIYTDFEQTEEEKTVCGIKVGDGETSLQDLTFITDGISEEFTNLIQDEVTRAEAEEALLSGRLDVLEGKNYVYQEDIVDDLSTNDPTKVLSANQGKVLHDDLLQESADRQVAELGLQNDIDDVSDAFVDHRNNKSNPHEVTKEQVGLGNVENLSPSELPISAATQAALDLKADEFNLATEIMERTTQTTNLNNRLMALENNVPGYITKDVNDLTNYYDKNTMDNSLNQKQDCISDISNSDIDNLF